MFGGGGNQQQRALPPPISDSARSVDIGSITEVICSGGNYGIIGLEPLLGDDYRKKIFLDNVPIVSNEGVFNFQPEYIAFLTGAPNQAATKNTGKFVSEISVGTLLTPGVPVVRAFTNPFKEINHFSVVLTALFQQEIKDSNGQTIQVDGTRTTLRIELKVGSGAYTTIAQLEPGGKYSSPYKFEYFFKFPDLLPDFSASATSYSIRLTRLTATPANATIELRWESYKQFSFIGLPLKRLAYFTFDFDTERWGTSVPERKLLLNGMFLDRPSNATIDQWGGINYSSPGTWDGTLVAPIGADYATGDIFCMIWFLLTDKIDGMGEFVPITAIDKWSLYLCSVYSNQILYTLNGIPERRHLFKLWMNTFDKGWERIDQLLSSFYVRKYWDGGTLRFTQDRPESITSIVTNADIVSDFIYSSTDIYDRANTIVASWVNPETYGTVSQEYISIPEYVQKYGIIRKDLEVLGCTSRSQAIRYARHVIYSENLEYSTVTFSARQILRTMTVGKVILITDNKYSADRNGGLIISASGATITLDSEVNLQQLSGYDEQFYLLANPDVRAAVLIGDFKDGFHHYNQHGRSEGRAANGYLLYCQTTAGLEIRRVTTVTGGAPTDTVTVSSALSTIESGHSWALFSPINRGITYRIAAVELDESNLDQINITATRYVESKYQTIERFYTPSTAVANVVKKVYTVPVPTDIKVFENKNTNGVSIRWTPPEGSGYKYVVGYRKGDNWVDSLVFSPQADLDLASGVYNFRVRTMTSSDLTSNWVNTGLYTIGFINFAMAPTQNALVFSLKKVNPNFAGNVVKIRRQDTGALGDFGFDYDGEISNSSVALFLGGQDGYLHSWVCQNTGYTLTAPTNAEQPQIASGGNLLTIVNKDGSLARCIHWTNEKYMAGSSIDRSALIDSQGRWSVFSYLQTFDGTTTDSILVGHNNPAGGSVERVKAHAVLGNTIYLDSGNITSRRIVVGVSFGVPNFLTMFANEDIATIRRNGIDLIINPVTPITLGSWSSPVFIDEIAANLCELIVLPGNPVSTYSFERIRRAAYGNL